MDQIIKNIRKSIYLLPLLAIALSIAQCGKVVPVKELADARAEIEEAELVNAGELAPEKFQAAREALLNAHKMLAEENLPAVKSGADNAQKLALEAREKAAPVFVARLKDNVRSVLNDAQEMNADSLAPEEFQAAQRYYQEGDEMLTDADSQEKGKGTIDDRHLVLRIYSDSYDKFVAAQEAAAKALQVALSKGGGLAESLAAIETLLRKAEDYQAPQVVPDLYNKASSDLEKARGLVAENNKAEGFAALRTAEASARAALDAAMDSFAKRRLDEAKAEVASAEESVQGGLAPAFVDSLKSEDEKKGVEGVRETLAAAKEALNSARSNYQEKKLDNSIRDSEEAIRLAQIIVEQVAILTKAERSAPTRVVKTIQPGTDIPEGWLRYEVQKKRPPECLWRIAGRKNVYGNPKLWKKIYLANKKKIRDPDLIFPGQVFAVPPRELEFDNKGNIIGGAKPAEITITEKEESTPQPENPPAEQVEPVQQQESVPVEEESVQQQEEKVVPAEQEPVIEEAVPSIEERPDLEESPAPAIEELEETPVPEALPEEGFGGDEIPAEEELDFP